MSGVGHFTDAASRGDFLRRYDELVAAIPGERTARDVPTSFGQVRTYRFGSAEGAPIVLLHGRGATSAMWAPNLPALAAEHPVYAIDTLGEPGQSVQTTPITSSKDQSTWLTEALDALGLDRPHLIGVSAGGWLTFNQAAHAPERTASASLVEPAHVLARFSKKFLLGGFALMPGLPARFSERYLQWVSGGPSMDTPIARLLTSGLRNYRVKLPMPAYGTDEILRGLRVPVLALLGGRSVVHDPREAAHRAQSLIPDNETELWPEATHALSGEFPEQLNARLLKFVAEH
jgi:pimeloyl-ACP methyl ester carboxylesterase